MTQKICESCGSRNIGPCESQLPGIFMRHLDACFCCGAVSYHKKEPDGSVEYLFKGEKNNV